MNGNTMQLKGKEIGEYVERFSSGEEMMEDAKEAIRDFQKDLDTWVQSIRTLWEEKKVPLFLFDSYLTLTFNAAGSERVRFEIGTKEGTSAEFAKLLQKDAMQQQKDAMQEEENA